MDALEQDRWKNRRQMAWFAFLFALALPLLEGLGLVNSDLAGTAITFCGTVVSVYIGGAVVDDKWQKD